MSYFYIAILILTLNAIQGSIYSNFKKNVLSILDGDRDSKDEPDIITHKRPMRYFQNKKQHDSKAKQFANKINALLKKQRTHEGNINNRIDMPSSKLIDKPHKRKEIEYFDEIMPNELGRRRYPKFSVRRGLEFGHGSSSEFDRKFWMEEWDEHWMQKKFEALNSTQPRGDVVNMVAARPWGVPCGDPNQHDQPWGSCMLPAECDGEYRIYRGDYFCGRTSYVCCALVYTNYDMYQGLDLSFEGSSFSSDSDEQRDKTGSKEDARKKRMAERNKRKKDRDVRKRRIKKSIKRIVTEITKILNRAYRNGTAQRKRKTKELKNFIKGMKEQYRKDRKAAVNIHELEMVQLDETLQQKLDQIKGVNEEFMSNDTFREIIVNGTINKAKLMKLLRAHPELIGYLKSRRLGVLLDLQKDEKEEPPAVEYDLEYGMLYY